MSKIVWLASYPKSGNTWTRAFFASLLHEHDGAVDINRLRTGMIASSRERFDEATGIEASDLTHAEIEELRPAVYRYLAEEARATMLVKVHDAYTDTPVGEPLFPAEVSHGVIYILRNPLDVAVSFAAHLRITIDQMIVRMGQPDFAFAARSNHLHHQLRQWLLSWSTHVVSWVDQQAIPVHILRYEDLHTDPQTHFAAAARFAGIPDDPESVAQAIELSRFEKLQAQEQKHGFNERPPGMPAFFRRGRAGGWRDELSEEQVARIMSDHADVMRRFGYLDADGNPTA
jgi:aryl sulfotransferase